MTEPDRSNESQRLKYRRAMRTSAMIFLVLSAIGFFATLLVALGGGTDKYPPDMLLERGFYAFALLVSASMAWHGSRFGAAFLLLIVMSGFLDLLAGGDLGFSLGRNILYTGMAAYMLWNAQKYHQACAVEGQSIEGSKLIRWGGIALVLPMAGLVAMGVIVMLNPVTTHVLTPSEMEEDHYRWLYEQEYLLGSESIEYFYANGLISVSEGGALLTNQYVGVWAEEDDGLNSYWIKLGEVCSVETVTEGDASTDAQYTVYGANEDNWIKLTLSTEQDGHERFLRRMNVLNKLKMHPMVKTACDAGEPLDRKALALANGIAPDIIAGDEISDEHLAWMREKDFLEDAETPLHMYSQAVYHIEESGTLLSDLYFGGWYQNQNGLSSSWARIGEICTIVPVDWENDGGDAVYKITFGAENWYQFMLPKGDGQDKRLTKRLRSMNDAAMTDETTAVCQNNPFVKQADKLE